MRQLLLYNVNVIRFDKRLNKICAILISNGFIHRLFTKRHQLPKNIKRIDLKNNYIMPGFIDCHTHLIARGIDLQRIDLGGCKSLNDCIDKLRLELAANRDILFGSDWDESIWDSFSIDRLNRHILDKISRKTPIIMRRVCGHFAVVNTKALNQIPKGWKIVDRKKGHLYEDVALNLNDIFKPTDRMLGRAVALASKEALEKGITSVHEISNLRRFKLLQQLKQSLKVRFSIYILLRHFKRILDAGLRSGLGDDYLKFCGIKVFLDGAIGAQTAALTKFYRNSRKRGRILISAKNLVNIVKKAEENNIQLMIHSIGDRSTKEILKILEKNINKKNPLRHRIEHLEILDNSSIRKMAKMNIIASMQPNFVRRWQQPGDMYEQYLGQRYTHMNCFKRLKDFGIKVVFGSDCMPLGPLYGIPGGFSHPFSCGRIGRNASFKMYTSEGAYATFDENKKGTIEVGKLADLVVLDKNPLEAKNLDHINILMTLVDGNIMYKRKS
jgi:hypothetical protein